MSTKKYKFIISIILLISFFYIITVFNSYDSNSKNKYFSDTPSDDSYEPNDNFLNATTIVPNYYPNLKIVNNNEDWFQIYLDLGTTIEIDIYFNHSHGDLELDLFDSSYINRNGSYSNSDNEFISYISDVSGYWRFRIYHQFMNSTVDYDLNLVVKLIVKNDDTHEENDYFWDPTNISGLSLLSGVQLDDDWYRIYLGGETELLNVELSFSNVTGNIDIEIYNSSYILISGSYSTNDNEYINVNIAVSGYYYIRIFGDNFGNDYNLSLEIFLPSIFNKESLNLLLNSKLEDYSNLGYFPTVYESSLQATYYGLYILDAIGKLNTVNHTRIINYIMSHKDASSSKFVDKLAYRYLDTDFSLGYFYPLSSVLQVTCYAILSLDILGRLDLINLQDSIDFIWSCQNLVSGGFIGQSYNHRLDFNFKRATLDNTYFAITTLDLLLTDWSNFTTKKDSIVQFIVNLQLPSNSTWDAGSFLNENDMYFDSILPLFEPNLLSSYYAIKTLQVFEMENFSNVGDFFQFLNYLYNPRTSCFKISDYDYGMNYTSIVATALGLELSDIMFSIMNFSSINRDSVVSFLLNNRNSLGNWDSSTEIPQHELIDTFQIIRSLKNSGELSTLPSNVTNEIGNATQLYFNYNGYSHLSKDFTSMNQLYTITSVFEQFNQISNLEVHELYLEIRKSYFENPQVTNSFAGYILKKQGFNILRSHPIEFYSTEIGQLNSHKSTYFALSTLAKMFKVDDFALFYDLNKLKNDIIASQFLNIAYYGSYGAFTSLVQYEDEWSEILSKKTFFPYTYYAIRSLELISDFQGIDLNDFVFNKMALLAHIERNIIESNESLYFNPQYTNNAEELLENTYYMIYILNTLNSFSKNISKIKNFVILNLDYSNIKNIYYSYKISENLNLELNFNNAMIQQLIQTLYSEPFHEFYLTSELKTIDQEVFLWICELTLNL